MFIKLHKILIIMYLTPKALILFKYITIFLYLSTLLWWLPENNVYVFECSFISILYNYKIWHGDFAFYWPSITHKKFPRTNTDLCISRIITIIINPCRIGVRTPCEWWVTFSVSSNTRKIISYYNCFNNKQINFFNNRNLLS